MVEDPEVQNEEMEEESQVGVGKKGGLRKIIVFLVVLVVIVAVLSGGAWLGYSMFFSGGQSSTNSGPGGEEEGEKFDVLDPNRPPGVLEFPESYRIRLRRDEGILRTDVYLMVSISLEIDSVEVQSEMEKSPAVMSRISDTIITYLASKYPSDVENRNWPRLKKDIIDLINRELPEKFKIRRLNFREFLTQPM